MKFTTSFKTNSKALWSAGAIIRILKTPFIPAFSYKARNHAKLYKVHKRITKNESEWIVIEDDHEAIITKIDFNSVQRY